MSAISSLPVEIWESILRRAIAVPDFLDADLGEHALVETLYKYVSNPMADESAYWSAERVRNCLQRVSKSWDGYLRRFEHRYVRLLDIRSGKVEPNKLTKAIRISLGRCDRSCTCVQSFSDRGQGSLSDFCRQTLREIDSLDAEIVDMQCELRSILPPESYPKLVRIKTLLACKCNHYSPLVQLINALPNLRRAYTGAYPGALRPTATMAPHLSSQSLQALTIRTSFMRNANTTLDLPSLRHLLIKCPSPQNLGGFGRVPIVAILGEIGGQLRSLHLHYRLWPDETLDEVWEMCPKLEVIYIRSSLPSSPPPFHPIHTLVVDYRSQLQQLKPLPEWPNLRRAVYLHPGGFAHPDDWDTSPIVAREGMRLEDANGCTLEEYGSWEEAKNK